VTRNEVRQQLILSQAAQKEAAEAERKAATDPLRDEALTGGLNTQKKVRGLDKSVQAAEKKVADQPIQGPLTRAYEGDPRYTPDDAFTPEALAARQDLDTAITGRMAVSANPVTPEKLVKALDRFAIADADRIGAGVANKVTALRKHLLSLDPKNKGYVDPASLYVIRKNIQSGKFNFVDGDNTTVVAIDGKLKADLVNFLDDTIGDSLEDGSRLWRDYVETYAEKSVPVNQAAIFEELGKVTKTDNIPGAFNTGAFSRAVGRDATKTADNAGARLPEGGLEELLTPEQHAVIKNIDADISLSNEAKINAGYSTETLEGVGKVEPLKLGNALIREIMIANAAGKIASNRATEGVITRLTELFKRDPEKGFAALAAELEKIGNKKSIDPGTAKLMEALHGVATVVSNVGINVTAISARQGSSTAAGRNFQ
jgi:hypothetical protein